MEQDEIYMDRCIQLGRHALGSSRPNPMVGSLIVYEDKIIGEGFTSAYGGAHAEVNAIHSVKDPELLKQSALYVTLEPCSHFGKTPPCSDLILDKGINRIVIGVKDPNPEVAGQGIAKLINSGCEVKVGVLEDKVKEHHKRFLTYQIKERPYIILKWAQTQNGFIAPLERDSIAPVWISNKYSRQLVHKWRSEEQAILVGTNTVRDDNPSLNVRLWSGRNPVKMIIDRNRSLDESSKVFSDESPVLISDENISFEDNVAAQICELLNRSNINSVIVEGGAKTIKTFIDAGLWDEARVFIGKAEFNDGIPAPELGISASASYTIAGDTLNYYYHD